MSGDFKAPVEVLRAGNAHVLDVGLGIFLRVYVNFGFTQSKKNGFSFIVNN